MTQSCGCSPHCTVSNKENNIGRNLKTILYNPRVSCPTWNAFLIALIILVFGQVVHFDFVYYDDYVYTVGKINKGNLWSPQFLYWALTSTDDGFWAPLTKISHRVDTHVFGDNAHGHHLINLILHTLNALILWRVLCRLTGDGLLQFLSVCIFTLHPLRIEPVAWIAGRKDLLSTFFLLLMLHKYMNWKYSRTKSDYLKVLLFFFLSALSKPVSIIFPLFLPVLDFLIVGNKEQEKDNISLLKQLLLYVPFFIISLFILLITLHAEQEAIVPTGVLSPLQRIRRVIVSSSAYALLTFIPINLHIPSGIEYYPFFTVYKGVPVYDRVQVVIFSLLVLSVVSTFWIFSPKNIKIGVGSFLLFLIPLLPVLGIIPFGHHLIADRFTYSAHIGFSLFLVTLSTRLYGITKRLYNVLLFLLILSFATVTVIKLPVWENGEKLFRNTLKYEPNCYVSYCNIGYSLIKQGRYSEAIPCLKRAIEENPLLAGPYNDLAFAYQSLGRYDDALVYYEKCIQLSGEDPQILSNVAVLYFELGDYEKSKSFAEKALKKNNDIKNAQHILEKIEQIEKSKLGG